MTINKFNPDTIKESEGMQLLHDLLNEKRQIHPIQTEELPHDNKRLT